MIGISAQNFGTGQLTSQSLTLTDFKTNYVRYVEI